MIPLRQGNSHLHPPAQKQQNGDWTRTRTKQRTTHDF